MCEEQSRDPATAANTALDRHCKQARDKSDRRQESAGARNQEPGPWCWPWQWNSAPSGTSHPSWEPTPTSAMIDLSKLAAGWDDNIIIAASLLPSSALYSFVWTCGESHLFLRGLHFYDPIFSHNWFSLPTSNFLHIAVKGGDTHCYTIQNQTS